MALPQALQAQACSNEQRWEWDGVRFSLGFMKSGPDWPFGSEGSYGAPGFGGALGYADPATGIGYGYVTNRAGASLTGDPRDVALRAALDAIVPSARGVRAPRAA